LGFNLASTVVTIRGVTKPLDDSLKAVKSKLEAMPKTHSISLGVLSGAAIGAGIKAFNLVLDAIQALVTAIPNAAMAAENLEHVIHRNKFMFQSMYPFIDKTVESLTRFGYTKGQLGGVTAKLGEMFVGMGMNEQMTGKLSAEFLKLGVDAAAFRNISLPEYMETLEHGLEGNVKALKHLGIFLMEGQVEQEKMKLQAMGMLGPFEEQNKKLATMSIIYSRLKNFQGEAARQMKLLTGEMKSLDAKTRSLVTSFGEVVKPMWTSGIKLFESALVSLVEAFERNKATVKSWADTLGAAFDHARFYFQNAGLYMQRFGLEAKGAFLSVVIALHNWKNMLLDVFLGVGKFLYEQPAKWFKGFTEALRNLANDLSEFAKWFVNLWKAAFESNETHSGRFFTAIADGLKDLVTSILTSLASGKPIEFKLRPAVAAGMLGLPAPPQFKTGGAQAAADAAAGLFGKISTVFNLDELKKAAALNVQQLAKLEALLKKQLDAFNKANKLPAERIPGIQRPQMMPGGTTTGGFVGITDFAKRIQEGALGHDAYQIAIANNTRRMAEMMALWGPRMMDIMGVAGMVGP
jgi:hypothetical protein